MSVVSTVISAVKFVYLCFSKNTIIFFAAHIVKVPVLVNDDGSLQPCHWMLLTQKAKRTEKKRDPCEMTTSGSLRTSLSFLVP